MHVVDVLGTVLRHHQPVPSTADLQPERDSSVPRQAPQRGAPSSLLDRRQRLSQHAAGSASVLFLLTDEFFFVCLFLTRIK